MIVHFKASSLGAGFYAVYIDGELVDAREGISLIVPGSSLRRSGSGFSAMAICPGDLRDSPRRSEARRNAGVRPALSRCARWSWSGSVSRCGRGAARSAAGAGPGPDPRRGLRRLPHRPARRRRRADRAEAAARPRPPDRRRGGRTSGRGRSASRRASGSACPGWAGPAASAATAAAAARTSATAPASPATTSTAATPSMASPTSASASRSRPATRTMQAAPLLCAGLIGYRALRLAGDARAARPLRLRRRGPHRRQVARRTRARRSSPSPARATRTGQAFARELGAVWAGGSAETAARGARRRHHLRPGRRAGARRRCGRCARGRGRLRRHPHERHPVASPTSILWGERALALGRQPDPARRRGVPRSSRRRCRCATEVEVPAR